MKVIIADDERPIRSLIKGLIDWERLGMEVVAEARNGNEAYSKCKELKPDVLITDVRMPGQSGLELISAIRDTVSNTQIVIISGYNDFSFVQTALRLNVVDYLLKPVSKIELEAALEKAASILRSDSCQRPSGINRPIGNQSVDEIGPLVELSNGLKDVDLRIKNTCLYLLRNYTKNPTLDEVADAVSLSSTYLSELFKKEMGMTFGQFLLKIRMTVAEDLLLNERFLVADIATRVGYLDPNYFDRVFKRHYGVTPSQYRNQQK